MSIEMLDDAIASHPFYPRFIVVDIELFSLLQEAGDRITNDHNPIEVDPVLDGNINVVLVGVDPLNPCAYRLPYTPVA